MFRLDIFLHHARMASEKRLLYGETLHCLKKSEERYLVTWTEFRLFQFQEFSFSSYLVELDAQFGNQFLKLALASFHFTFSRYRLPQAVH